MADYVRDGSREKPPPLQFYLNVQALGDPFGGGWMEWPQRTLDDYRIARNVYESMKGYVQAEHKVAWANGNPEAWQIAGRVVAMEMERDEVGEADRYGVWLRWRYGIN